jgi:hypothetical protein
MPLACDTKFADQHTHYARLFWLCCAYDVVRTTRVLKRIWWYAFAWAVSLVRYVPLRKP